MLWLALGAAVPVIAALTWWRGSRRAAVVATALSLGIGFVVTGLVGQDVRGDFSTGLLIGLPVLIAQAVSANRSARSVR